MRDRSRGRADRPDQSAGAPRAADAHPGDHQPRQRNQLHRIAMEDLGEPFGGRGTLKTDYEYFETLRKLGQRATRRFLDAHFSDIGRRSTIDFPAKAEPELVD